MLLNKNIFDYDPEPLPVDNSASSDQTIKNGTADQIKSGEKSIVSFDFFSLIPIVIGSVDQANHTVTLNVPLPVKMFSGKSWGSLKEI